MAIRSNYNYVLIGILLMLRASTISSGATPTGKAATPTTKPAAVISGRAAPDAPLFEFAMRKQHLHVNSFEATWLPTSEYAKYSLVAIVGGPVQDGGQNATFNAKDLNQLQTYLEGGGTLLLSPGGLDALKTPDGVAFLQKFIGKSNPARDKNIELRRPAHPWVIQLIDEKDLNWLAEQATSIRTSNAENILGSDDGRSILCRTKIGHGQLIYIGWEFSKWIPDGRNLKSTVDDEKRYESQFHVLTNIIRDLYHPQNSN